MWGLCGYGSSGAALDRRQHGHAVSSASPRRVRPHRGTSDCGAGRSRSGAAAPSRAAIRRSTDRLGRYATAGWIIRVLLGLMLTACSMSGGSIERGAATPQALLDALAAAERGGDTKAVRDLIDSDAPTSFVSAELARTANLRSLPLSVWRYRIDSGPADAGAVAATFEYAFTGADVSPAERPIGDRPRSARFPLVACWVCRRSRRANVSRTVGLRTRGIESGRKPGPGSRPSGF